MRDVPDLVPVLRNYYQSWSLRVFRRDESACRNTSSNRRDVGFLWQTGRFTR